MKHAIRRFPRLWRQSRLLRRWYHARRDAYPEWEEILSRGRDIWEAAQTQSGNGKRVLLSTAIGSYAHAVSLESALAAALRLRGAEPHVLLCDSALSACAECDVSLYPSVDRFVEQGPSGDLCNNCFKPALRVYTTLGVRVHRMSALVTSDTCLRILRARWLMRRSQPTGTKDLMSESMLMLELCGFSQPVHLIKNRSLRRSYVDICTPLWSQCLLRGG